MIASIINVIGGHRLSKAWEKLQTKERNKKITILLGLALLNIILARTNYLYNAAFFMQVQMHDLCTYN